MKIHRALIAKDEILVVSVSKMLEKLGTIGQRFDHLEAF